MSDTVILSETAIDYPNNALITLNIGHASNTVVTITFLFYNSEGVESSFQPVIEINPGDLNPLLCQVIITSNVLTVQINNGPQNMYYSQYNQYDPTISDFISLSVLGQNNDVDIYTTATIVSNAQYFVPFVPPGSNMPFPSNNTVLIACTVIAIVLLVLAYIFVIVIMYSIRKRTLKTDKKVWNK